MKGNLDLLLNLFDLIMQPDNLKRIWELFDSLIELLGVGKVGSQCFDVGIF